MANPFIINLLVCHDSLPYHTWTNDIGVDRALETWRKSSKIPVGKDSPVIRTYNHPNLPLESISRLIKVGDPRMNAMAPRFAPPTEFDPMRMPPTPGHVQGYIATQRFGGPRPPTEGDPAMQAKRRMAAQRERELRNYHQEQQFQKRT